MTSVNNLSNLDDYVVALIDAVAKQHGFTEYTVQQSPGSNKGDGLIGVILRISLTGLQEINGVSKEATLSVICKVSSSDPDIKLIFDQSFQNEIYAYTEILPEFVKFQQEKGISKDEGFFNFPKIYAIHADYENKNFAIIMEDMKAKYYELKIVSSFDFHHAKLVMESLGKFHAISFAFRDQKPDIFQKYQNIKDVLISYIDHHRNQQERNLIEISFDKAIQIWNPKDECIVEKMQNYSKSLIEILSNCVDGMTSEPFSVINHGDCKNLNFMFLYNEEKLPQEICLFDWQIIRYGSPVLDITYFLFPLTDKKFRDEHYEELLQIYHKALADFLNKLGSDADRLFSYKNLKDQLQKFGKFGIFSAPVIIQMSTTDAGLEYEEMLRGNENKVDGMDLYTEKIIAVFDNGVKLGYI